MKRFFAFSILVLAFVPLSAKSALAECYRPNCWGAIAIGTGSGAWTWVVNHPTAGTARARALGRCGGRCNRVLTFRNSCASYAVASNGGWGWSNGYRDRYGAEQRALFECNRYNPGQGCQVRVWACTSR